MQVRRRTVFLDANVLFSRTFRDWFCLLALVESNSRIELKWSEDVIAEVVYSLRRKNPWAPEHVTGGTRRRLTGLFPYSMVTDYEIDSGFLGEMNDEFDRHVLAAALKCGADLLVTGNKGDFPELVEFQDIRIVTADQALCELAELFPEAVFVVAMKQQEYWRNRQAVNSIDEALERAKALKFARIIREMLKARS